MKVWLKDDVYGDLAPPMQKIHGKIVDYYESRGFNHFYVTSRRDGKHMAGSFHYIGLAEDFLKEATITKDDLKQVVGPDCDVIENIYYFHVEYDPKGKE